MILKRLSYLWYRMNKVKGRIDSQATKCTKSNCTYKVKPC